LPRRERSQGLRSSLAVFGGSTGPVGSGGVWVGELRPSGKSFDVSKWEVHDAWEKVVAGQQALHVGKRSGVPE